jgi:hypothetical protein
METLKYDESAEKGVRRLFAALAESSLHDSDAEVLRDAGPEASLKAEHVRSLLLDTVKAHKQRALNAALAVYREEVRRYKERRFAMPTDSREKRELLTAVLGRFPQGERTFLTLQHREFKNLSDADIESLLKQLEALGVLDGESR